MMKRRIVSALIVLLLLLCMSVPVLASSQRTLDLVTDAAGILTADEAGYLNAEAERLTQIYGCEVIIVTVESLDGYYVQEFSEAVFETYQYGYGADRSCIMLLLSYYDREYDILAHGYGNTVFTDARKDIMVDYVVPYLGEDNWYGAFDMYLKICEDFLYADANGLEYGEYDAPGSPAGTILITVLLSAIPAAIVVRVMRGKMKTAVRQRNATAYIADNGVNISYRDDRYIRSNIQRVPKSSESSKSSGGKTTVNSGGFSHRSGKF